VQIAIDMIAGKTLLSAHRFFWVMDICGGRLIFELLNRFLSLCQKTLTRLGQRKIKPMLKREYKNKNKNIVPNQNTNTLLTKTAYDSSVIPRGVLPSSSVVLRAEGLVKVYGKRRVVDGVSFYVNKGEIVGLLGPNGAGKTTSFRMVCGLISSNGGIVYLGPHDITNWPMYRRSREGGMGYLPQDKSVFQKLSVQNNLLAVMEMIGVRRQDRHVRCNELLEKFKLTHLRRNMGGSLSGGEKRRLEIARALVSNPKIILLDEPFAAVDPITVTSIQTIIRQLAIEGISILITDHSVQDTLQITHRSYVIRAGQVLCHGTPEEVLNNAEARKVYFGENVSVGQIQSASLHPRRQDNFFPNDNNSNPNNTNTPAPPQQTKHHNTTSDPLRPDDLPIISGGRMIEPNFNSNQNARPELRPELILPTDANLRSGINRTRPEITQQPDISTQPNEAQNEFVVSGRIDTQSPLIKGSINSSRTTTRRLIPSTSSSILPPNSERSTVRQPSTNQQKNHDTPPTASGIMRVLGTMFFGKNS
jgi:lipopolysaccharide export system ATP-binding protein